MLLFDIHVRAHHTSTVPKEFISYHQNVNCVHFIGLLHMLEPKQNKCKF